MKKIFTLLSGLLIAAGISASAQESQTVSCQVLNESYKSAGEAQEATLTLENGVYTLTPFFGTGGSLSFTLSDFVDDGTGDKEAEMDFTGDNLLYDEEEYAYWIMKESDTSKYATASYTDLDENTVKLKYPLVYNDGYSLVYEYDGYDKLYAYIMVCGQNTISEEWPYMFIHFTYNKFSDTTGIEAVGAEENAPAVYYNLNGQKVENPSNGIFVRKQGGKTSKVVVR